MEAAYVEGLSTDEGGDDGDKDSNDGSLVVVLPTKGFATIVDFSVREPASLVG